MKMQWKLTLCALASAMTMNTWAIGGPSGMKTVWYKPGELGAVMVNPYKIAPLTAIIKNDGWVLTKAHVRIIPKDGDPTIQYNVGPQSLRTYGGIPVWGLYPDYINQVEVSYTRIEDGKEVSKKEVYPVRTGPVYFDAVGIPTVSPGVNPVTVKVPARKEFEDRLYFINNLGNVPPTSARFTWNSPEGGTLQWQDTPQNFVIDTKGNTRWFMNFAPIYDPRDPYRSGIMMGFHQTEDGALSWGFGQRYVKYDLMGREIFNRLLPRTYDDFSHALALGPNGHQFLRVALNDYRRPDGTHVRTVRDVIIEVDKDGNVVDEWRLFDIMDSHRDILLKAVDQGAVCLNVDASKLGQTMSAEALAKLDAQNKFGDIVGTGPGRNWAHVNSIDYDEEDDSIILSFRHQGIAKIGRDKKVKWILAAPNGWNNDLKPKVLTPVDKNGKALACRIGKCEGGFDWSWTQHTAWKIDEKSKGDILYLSVFDNGDARAFVQPEDPKEKYSRAVVYKIDQKKGTVEQVWRYGKERGHELYSPITSVVEYQKDHDSLMTYWASIGLAEANTVGTKPVISEFKWGATKPSVELQLEGSLGYRALTIDLEKAFAK